MYIFLICISSDTDMSSTPPGSPSSSSVYIESSSSLTPSEIANQLRDKLTPMRRNRRLMTDDITLLTSPRHSIASQSFQQQHSMNVESSMSQASGSKQQQQQQQGATAAAGAEKPVFTLQQMTLVCERLCKVRYGPAINDVTQILKFLTPRHNFIRKRGCYNLKSVNPPLIA